MKAVQLLEMAASAMEAAAPPNSFGGNAMLRKLGQVMKLATDTGLGSVEVTMPKEAPKKAPKSKEVPKRALRKKRGGTPKGRAATRRVYKSPAANSAAE